MFNPLENPWINNSWALALTVNLEWIFHSRVMILVPLDLFKYVNEKLNVHSIELHVAGSS